MNSSKVDASQIQLFLRYLSSQTTAKFSHLFATTNWDYLLQREILGLGLSDLPRWLADSHVSHLNGTVEPLKDNSQRSPFLLEEDDSSKRSVSVEANKFFNEIVWGKIFIVVGMSFECETDRALLHAIHKIEDELPIGDSCWIIVNPDNEALKKVKSQIRKALPNAKTHLVCQKMSDWQNQEFPELKAKGVFV